MMDVVQEMDVMAVRASKHVEELRNEVQILL